MGVPYYSSVGIIVKFNHVRIRMSHHAIPRDHSPEVIFHQFGDLRTLQVQEDARLGRGACSTVSAATIIV